MHGEGVAPNNRLQRTVCCAGLLQGFREHGAAIGQKLL
jgi:hypothetical protein